MSNKTVFPKLLLTLTGFTLTLRQNRVVEGKVTISQLTVVFSISSNVMAREHLSVLRRTFLGVVISSAASMPDLYQKKNLQIKERECSELQLRPFTQVRPFW